MGDRYLILGPVDFPELSRDPAPALCFRCGAIAAQVVTGPTAFHLVVEGQHIRECLECPPPVSTFTCDLHVDEAKRLVERRPA